MMDLRILESLHGHAAILALALLFHPALLLWRGRPLSFGSRVAVLSAGAMSALAFALGIAIYPGYRAHVKPSLFMADPRAGLLFESKEHLAWLVLTLALGASITALAAPRRATLARRLSARLFLGAALVASLTAALGTYVTSVRGF